MRAFILLLLSLAAAGCTAPPPADLPASPILEEAPASFALAPPERVMRAPLDVSLALSERWLKPLRPFDVALDAPTAARVAWFVEYEDVRNASADASGSSASRPAVEPRATLFEGAVFVLKSTTPDRHNTEPPRAPLSVSALAPDGRARALAVTTSGRHTLAGGGAELVINAWPGAPEGAAQAFLVQEGDGLRFEPPELDVAPGTRVLLWNQAVTSVPLREVGFAAYVPLEAREGRITPIDEGLWRILALAVDGDARGLASSALLVDFERPSDRLLVGPFRGELLLPEAPVEPSRRLTFRADHPLEHLTVTFSTRSHAPAPASVTVALFQEGSRLAETSSLAASEIVLADLPAGKYAMEVRGEHGAIIAYEVAAEGRYRLPMPERLREMAT